MKDRDIDEWVRKYRKVDPVIFTEDPQTSARSRARTKATTGLEAYAGEWGEQQASHLLKRTLFGYRKTDLKHFQALGLTAAIDELISTSPIPTAPANNYNDMGEGVEDPDVPFGESFVDAPRRNELEGPRITSLKGWLVQNLIDQENTIHEKMILFWNNLIPAKIWDVFVSKTSYRYFETLRTHALGNFRELIKAITLDPSMLIFLNGAWNHKYAPDENYARELQELFCIGKGPNAKFSESDVQTAARLLTGNTIDWDNQVNATGPVESFFKPEWHDSEDKTFSAFYGNRVIQGRQGLSAEVELDELISMLMDNDETALYLCRRLYNFFVHPEIDETVETQMIEPMATMLRDNDYEIMPVIKAMFSSAHFYDESNLGAMIKSPTDHLIGFWRTMNVQYHSQETTAIYRAQRSLLWSMAEIGQELGDPPNVAGWQAYYQVPSYDRLWITTDSITKRAIRIDSLIHWGFWVSESETITADLIAFAETLDNPQNPNTLIEEAAMILLGIPISQETKDYLKSILLSGQQTDGYWLGAWIDYQDFPDNMEFKQIVETRLKATMQAMCQLGEFQLM
ncbi:DUF1800 domain-containing protein [Reichenbachiella ulvae]|uniref:DUF1800 domain-containing protein n=1 Tax=Reichenbachiella ulvae TaxID=2980104 RepID=A0ABT3CS30_9BACT|nr:DUF1800 domain-containing protein [Reichenbachiella ulvae]MCV9386304.1 DUF1800 domain-containing protein [Reichenbachiella ulvae]